MSNEQTTQMASAGMVDTKLEVVVLPVSDADRAKRFYGSLGWRLDADFCFDNGFRVVQFTPPGSGCSVQFGTHITSARPGWWRSRPGRSCRRERLPITLKAQDERSTKEGAVLRSARSGD